MSKKNSELQAAAQKITAGLQVKIQKHPLSQDDMLEFIEHVKAAKVENPEVIISLTDYVTDKLYKGQKDVVVVPDLAGLTIGTKIEYDKVEDITTEDLDRGHEDYLDLSGVDFTGANIRGANFEACNLKNASFCDTDLSNVSFNDCYMPGADMRGADISNCSLSETDIDDRLSYNSSLKPVEISELAIHNHSNRYAGMQFSSLEPLMHQYRDANEEIEKLAEERYEIEKAKKLEIQEEKITKKETEIQTAYDQLSYWERFRGSNEEYNQLNTELSELSKEKKAIQDLSFEDNFDKRDIQYVVHPSIAELPLLMDDVGVIKFDPAYKRGSNKEEREQEKQYVRLTREDAENYIEALKTNPQLTLNEFARVQMSDKGIEAIPGAKIVADFSTYIEDRENALYAGVAVDLSGLDFSGAKLQESCFAGANLKNTKFNGADLSLATFEGADLTGAEFIKTIARDVNMFAAKVGGAKFFDKSDFSRAYMPHSSAYEAQVEGANFDFADIRNGQWDGVQITDSTFNYADLQGVSLANAVIKQTKMQHANLDKAILENCQMIEADLTGALLANAKAEGLKLQQTILKDVDARGIDLSGAEIDELCKLQGANLENAILRKIEADRVNFVGANMKGVQAAGAHLEEAVLEGVNMRFSDFEDAIMHGVKASGVDMTGANLTDVKAKKAQFVDATLEGMKAHKADFEEAVMEGANLRGVKMREAILRDVNLKKADLRNAEMPEVKLGKAKMHGAKVNDATDLHGADIEGVTGELEHKGLDGTKTKISVEEKVKNDNEVHAAKNKGTIGKWCGNVLKKIGNSIKKVGEFIKQPLSTKWGRIIGAVAGVTVGILFLGLFTASVAATGGASLAVVAAVAAGTIAISAGIGAATGHYGAKHMGLSTAVGVVGGALMGGVPGAVFGGYGAVGLNGVVKGGVGQSLDELGGNGIIKIGEGLNAVGKAVGVSEEQEQLLAARKQSQEAYTAPRQEPKVAVTDEVRRQNWLDKQALAQSQSVAVSPELQHGKSVEKVEKQQVVRTELQEQAHRVGERIDHTLKSEKQSQSQTPPGKVKKTETGREVS